MLRAPSRVYASIELLVRRHLSTGPGLRVQHRALSEFKHAIDVEEFRCLAVPEQEEAVILRGQARPGNGNDPCDDEPSVLLPALTKWFAFSEGGGTRFSPYFRQHLSHSAPYELLLQPRSTSLKRFLSRAPSPLTGNLSFDYLPSLSGDSTGANPVNAGERAGKDTRFLRFDAPLALLDSAVEFNRQQDSPGNRLSQLYVAQALLSDLPHKLQLDVPTPRLLAAPASGALPFAADVYGSSIWLGLEPTYTPWHRDPNHNLFCQLCGSKVMRLMPPRAGERLFRQVMARLGRPGGSAAIRGAEMMQGAERQAWLDAVWGPHAPPDMLEVELRPRDVLYLRKDWWHSVKSLGSEGGLNASVNWWFRWRQHRPRARPDAGLKSQSPTVNLQE